MSGTKLKWKAQLQNGVSMLVEVYSMCVITPDFMCSQEMGLAKIHFELGTVSSILCYFTHITLSAKKL